MVAAPNSVQGVTCGTISGYTTHHVKGEPRCQDCKDAVAAYERRRRRDRGINPPGVAECGTYSGFTSHNKRREEPCRSCKDAHNEYQRRYRAKVRLRERRGTIIEVIADYAETYRPVSVSELVLLIRLRHDLKPSTIKRTVYKMLRDGHLSDTDVVRR
jgi:hypothetical protein